MCDLEFITSSLAARVHDYSGVAYSMTPMAFLRCYCDPECAESKFLLFKNRLVPAEVIVRTPPSVMPSFSRELVQTYLTRIPGTAPGRGSST